MAGNQASGKQGELEVVEYVPCPNCGKRLMQLPTNYPLNDVQCTGCSFRAQVKTNNHKPSSVVFGAGWEILHKVTKSGYLVPMLFLNFKWKEKGKKRQEVRFYPFVPKINLKKHQLSKEARRAGYWMFNYTGMNSLPFFVVYQK